MLVFGCVALNDKTAAGAAKVLKYVNFLGARDASTWDGLPLACRSTYPETVWKKILDLFPDRLHATERPFCIDIAVGSEGRAGVELAKRCDAVQHLAPLFKLGAGKHSASRRYNSLQGVSGDRC